MVFPSTIVDRYHHDRAQASTSDDKDRVWRMYARAVIEEDARRGNAIGDPFIVWRRSHRDVDLSKPFQPYWRALPLDDLKALWVALERARHRVAP